MARYEMEGHPGLSGTHEYSYPFRSPAHITRQTSQCLDLLSIDIADKSYARNFLANDTQEFLEGVRRGFLEKFSTISEKRNVREDDLQFFYHEQEKTLPADDEDVEAFDFTLVTFCAMPEYAEYAFLPHGFSRRGVLAPPFTLMEFYLRIQELQAVNSYIADGANYKEDLRDPSVLRYGLYHRVGSTLPLAIDTRAYDKEKQIEEQWNKFLEDVAIDL